MHEKYAIQQAIAEAPVIHPAIFQDNADCTFNYETEGTGTGWAAAYQTAVAHSGLNGIYLHTRVAGPQINDSASMSKRLPLPATKRLTLQLVFAFGFPTNSRFILELTPYLPDNICYRAALRFLQNPNIVQYRNLAYVWTTIDGLTFSALKHHWNHLLLAFSYDPPFYRQLTVNNRLIAPADIPLYKCTHSLCPHLLLYLNISTAVASFRDVRIDQLLLTPDNP